MAEAPKQKKKSKRIQVLEGIAHAYCSFNNTIITITDVQGNALSWSSAASCNYRGSRKSTPYAGGEAAQKAAQKAIEEFGMKSLQVRIKGPGSARESVIRAFNTSGLKVVLIDDVTPLAHNGVRRRKKRRV